MPSRLARSAAVLFLSTAVLSVGIPAAQAAQPADVTGAKSDTRRVDYFGYRLTVPGGWQVVDLAKTPHACVRFDRNVVYLGTPGADQDCPAHVVAGRTDGLLIQPVPTAVRGVPAAPVVGPGEQLPAAVLAAGAAGHELRAQIRGTGLEVTASYGATAKRVNRILAGARATAAAPPAAKPRAPRAAARAATAVPSTDAAGLGFDTCAAPSAEAMSAWVGGSPYKTVGVYIGGPEQACAQPNLTADWVGARAAEGWSFQPIYVGRQAAIGAQRIAADAATARQQGADQAADAMQKAQALGFQAGSVLYDDMENYDPGYRDRVLAYLSGWTSGLRSAGYRSGVYSSASSGVHDLADRYYDPSYPRPDVIWSASWNSRGDTSDAAMGLPGADYWPSGRRAHQYTGNSTESYNGVQIAIDADALSVAALPAVPTATGDRMTSGERLSAGQSVSSANAVLTMQSDGNLVLYPRVGGDRLGPATWSSQTSGNPGAYAVLQADGNLVVYQAGRGDPAGSLWAAGTWGSPGAYAVVQDDGNLVVYRQGRTDPGGSLWSTGSNRVGRTLTAGQRLMPGQWNDARLTRLIMQSDGNLVLYRKRDGAALWSSGSRGNPGAYAVMQADGNLVVYLPGRSDPAGALWSSLTWGNPGALTIMQDDGNLVVYRPGHRDPGGALWSSGTWWYAG